MASREKDIIIYNKCYISSKMRSHLISSKSEMYIVGTKHISEINFNEKKKVNKLREINLAVVFEDR